MMAMKSIGLLTFSLVCCSFIGCSHQNKSLEKSDNAYFTWDIKITPGTLKNNAGLSTKVYFIDVVLKKKYEKKPAEIVKTLEMMAAYKQDAVFHREINGELLKAVFSVEKLKNGDSVSCDLAIAVKGINQIEKKSKLVPAGSSTPIIWHLSSGIEERATLLSVIE